MNSIELMRKNESSTPVSLIAIYGGAALLAFSVLAVLYGIDLFSWYAEDLLFPMAVLFFLSAIFAISLLFFCVDGFSLGLALLLPYLVFIGGRIFVLVATGDLNVFEYTYFTYYQPGAEEAVKLVIQAAVGFLAIFFGYLVALIFFQGKVLGGIVSLWNPARWGVFFLMLALPVLMIELLAKFNLVLSDGYAALYLEQVDTYSGSLLSFGLTLLTLALCFGFVGSNKAIRRGVIFSYSLVYLLMGVLGQRGPIFSLLILLAALAFEKRNIRQKVMYSVLAVLGVMVLMMLFSFATLRDYTLESRYGSSLVDFLYEQGGTLSIYGISLGLNDYPLGAYVQNFIPGFAVFSNLLGYPVSADELSFGAYLSKSLNNQLYDLGQGVGWSLLGDAFQFFGNFYPFFLMALGVALGYVDSRKYCGGFFLGLWILLLAKIPFLPRASTGSVILPVAYFAAAWLFVSLLSKSRSIFLYRRLPKS